MAPPDGMQTPSGLETPSGMTSVVSTVAGGLETPDFLELRKNASTRPTSNADSGPRALYQVIEEKQTSVRGLMGSDRGYDLRGTSGSSVPVLGEERGTKVCLGFRHNLMISLTWYVAQSKWRGPIHRCVRARKHVGRRAPSAVRRALTWQRRCAGVEGGLLGHGGEGDGKEEAEDGDGPGEGEERKGVQVLSLSLWFVRFVCCVITYIHGSLHINAHGTRAHGHVLSNMLVVPRNAMLYYVPLLGTR